METNPLGTATYLLLSCPVAQDLSIAIGPTKSTPHPLTSRSRLPTGRPPSRNSPAYRPCGIFSHSLIYKCEFSKTLCPFFVSQLRQFVTVEGNKNSKNIPCWTIPHAELERAGEHIENNSLMLCSSNLCIGFHVQPGRKTYWSLPNRIVKVKRLD